MIRLDLTFRFYTNLLLIFILKIINFIVSDIDVSESDGWVAELVMQTTCNYLLVAGTFRGADLISAGQGPNETSLGRKSSRKVSQSEYFSSLIR